MLHVALQLGVVVPGEHGAARGIRDEGGEVAELQRTAVVNGRRPLRYTRVVEFLREQMRRTRKSFRTHVGDDRRVVVPPSVDVTHGERSAARVGNLDGRIP